MENNTGTYVMGSLLILIFMYYRYKDIELSRFATTLFKNDLFRVIFLSLLLTSQFKQSPTSSILMALFFIIIMDRIMTEETDENFTSIGKSLNTLVRDTRIV